MLHARRTVLLPALLLVGLLSLPAPQPADAEVESLVERAMKGAQANNAFAADLYQRVRGGTDNLFFSPYSITTALAMTRAGADGETARQMDEVLHTKGLGAIEQMALREALTPKQVVDYKQRERTKVASYRLEIANALWGQEQFAFEADFLKRLEEEFLAPMYRVNFAQAEMARSAINSWVEKKTQDRIKDLIPSGAITADMRLVLANAIYFKANWADEFSARATMDAPFHAPGGDVQAKMMRRTGHYAYAERGNLRLLEIPYRGRDTSMVVLLPKSKDGLAEIEKGLTAKRLADDLAALKGTRVALQLPRFSFTKPLELGDILKAMGMPLAFNADKADFSKMTKEQRLFIGAVLHKAFIKLDEKGTEAAAATAVMMRAGSAMPVDKPVPFVVDRPFTFVIRHRRTGAILFMGRVTDPTR